MHAGYPQAAIDELNGLVEAIDDMGIPGPSGLKIFALSEQAVIALHHGLFTAAERALELRSALMMEQAERVGTDEFRRGQEASIAYFEGVLAARRGDYETASAKAQEFMSLMAPDNNPRKNEPAHDLLGLISLLQGNHAQAVANFEQADPNNVYTTYHLAVAHEGAGNSEDAKKLFRELAVYNFNAVGFALVRKDVIEKAQ